MQRAVEDGATVPIHYKSRLAKLDLREDERPRLDAEFDEVTDGEELEHKERLKSKWAALEALLGTETRVQLIARDLVDTVRRNVSMGWTVREGVRAKLRVPIKRVLRRYGYPPEFARNRMAMQAEYMAQIWEYFPDVRAIVPLFEGEVRGVEMLERTANKLFA
jgi:hypothetical protein